MYGNRTPAATGKATVLVIADKLEAAGRTNVSVRAADKFLRELGVQAFESDTGRQEPGVDTVEVIQGTHKPAPPAAGPTTSPNAGPATEQPGAVPTPSQARSPGPAAGSGGRGDSARRASVTFTLREVGTTAWHLYVEAGRARRATSS